MTTEHIRQMERVEAMRASLIQNESALPSRTRAQYMKCAGGRVEETHQMHHLCVHCACVAAGNADTLHYRRKTIASEADIHGCLEW